MRKIIKLVFVLLIATTATYSQTISVCLLQNNTTIPPSDSVILCRNTPKTLVMRNCAATPETNISYRWENISNLSIGNIYNDSAIVADTGKWVGYIINNGTLAEVSDTIHLYYTDSISITTISAVPNNSNFCPAEPVTLTITPYGPITNYQWYDNTNGGIPPVLLSGQTNSSFTFYDKPKTIYVEASDANGCKALAIRSYGVLPSPAANIGSDPTPKCVGDVVTVQNIPSNLDPGYGNVRYGYYRDGVYINGIAAPANPPGTYLTANIPLTTSGQVKIWIRVWSHWGAYCDNTDTIYVTVNPLPTVNLGNDTLICYGDNSVITPTFTGKAPYDLSGAGLGWTSSPAGFTSSANPVTVNPTSTTTYTLMVRDANNCGIGQDNKLVSVNPQINIAISNDTTICKLPQGVANLNATLSGGIPGYTYGWTPTQSLSTIPATVFSTTTDTSNTATFTFTATDATNCTISESVTVTLYEPPIAAILPDTINEEKSITLDASLAANSGFTFEWYTNLNPIVFSNSSSIFLEYKEPDIDPAGTNYIIRVIDPSNGCENIDTINIKAISNGTILYVPNIFSPAAESTMNQRLKIFSRDIKRDDFKIIVYNKWGNLVHETTNYDNMVVEIYSPDNNTINNDNPSKGWDGGAMVEGVYTYVIIGSFRNGKNISENEHYKGTFSLVR